MLYFQVQYVRISVGNIKKKEKNKGFDATSMCCDTKIATELSKLTS